MQGTLHGEGSELNMEEEERGDQTSWWPAHAAYVRHVVRVGHAGGRWGDQGEEQPHPPGEIRECAE